MSYADQTEAKRVAQSIANNLKRTVYVVKLGKRYEIELAEPFDGKNIAVRPV